MKTNDYTFKLSYRPPFDWPRLLNYFRLRAVDGVETVSDRTYRRSFCLHADRGWLSLQNDPEFNAVRLVVHASGRSCLADVVRRVRRMLDLDADPLVLDSFFSKDDLLGAAWLRYSGLRVPVCWDPFELAVRAIVGQLISVRAATKLVGNIAASFGETHIFQSPKGIEKVFPGPSCLQGVDTRPCGLTRNKADAIMGLAHAVEAGTIDLETVDNLDVFVKKCIAFKGIGEWTAHTIAMRGLGYKDAFPAGDLGIVKALANGNQSLKPAQIRRLAERWRPWRSYAAMLLWILRSE